LVDQRVDPALRSLVISAKKMLDNVDFLEMKIRLLALFVANMLGGSQTQAFAAEWSITSITSSSIHQWKDKYQSNVVPIGEITFGSI